MPLGSRKRKLVDGDQECKEDVLGRIEQNLQEVVRLAEIIPTSGEIIGDNNKKPKDAFAQDVLREERSIKSFINQTSNLIEMLRNFAKDQEYTVNENMAVPSHNTTKQVRFDQETAGCSNQDEHRNEKNTKKKKKLKKQPPAKKIDEQVVDPSSAVQETETLAGKPVEILGENV